MIKPNTPTTASGAGPTRPMAPDQTQAVSSKQLLLKDIRLKWGKFSDQELTELKSNDDLVRQLVAKYGLEKAAAQRDADMLRAGRDI